MIRKRFPKERLRRIAAWTAMALAWGTAVVARTVGAPAAATPEVADVAAPAAPTATAVPTTTLAPVPDMPEDGLVVLRFTPAERPEPEVRRIVVSQPAAGGGGAASPPPTTKASSGS